MESCDFIHVVIFHTSFQINTGMRKMRKHIVARVHIWFLALQAALERWEAGSTGPSKLLAILHMLDTDSIYTHSSRISYESIKSLCSAAAAWYALTSGSLSVSSCATNHDQSVQLLPRSFFSKFLKSWHTCLSFGLDTNLSGTAAAAGCSGCSPTSGTFFAWKHH